MWGAMLPRIDRYRGLVALLLAAVSLCSCTPILSLHPLYTDKDVYFDPGLIGIWVYTTDSEQTPITFERLGSNGYTVSGTDTTETPPLKYSYEAHLVKLDGHLFMDVKQSSISAASGDITVLAIPAHMFGEVSFDQDNLTVKFFGEDWPERSLESSAITIRHETTDDGVPVLTATTADLQRFIAAHIGDEKVFPLVLGPLRRKK